ncbi:NUDIX domain-containing protein [Clostridium algidicarnis]|uniref:NUDIX domain-containing protein n=1 Tax=Clostridium algidicarnis TaxID=37659 RepID=UPI001C0CF50A|nr:NUDIX domain-containing protein [Clostridium algidicarnis]MBU3204393.1 NUDIX domain-containing protein [Clostridium algidicarnis]MBU3212523.1 NUDIX domain-containing protein [Clostridium algidicarnis]MBU3222954.1 NUDIX domain-containing protein [Clostridium algidicarnis]
MGCKKHYIVSHHREYHSVHGGSIKINVEYTDFLQVAIKESKEETGINTVTALTKNIVSIDIIPVYGHVRRNKYISEPLHLSIAYVLIANGKVRLIVKKDENRDVTWFSLDKFTKDFFVCNIAF